MRRILLFGGSGQLGSEIVRSWTDVTLSAPARSVVNFADASAVSAAIAAFSPDVVINATAYHNVEKCEADPAPAFEMNALAVDSTAIACAGAACTFVTFSTDYVFSGDARHPYSEIDAPSPLNAYGVSKLAGELLLQRSGAKAFIVRTSGLYGQTISTSKGYTFIDKIFKQARAGEQIRVVDDMTFSPSYAGHVAAALQTLLTTEAYGTYHMANAGEVTWFEFAGEALRQANLAVEVEPTSYKSWPSKVRRPAYSALNVGKLRSLGIVMPTWQEGVAAYVSALT